MSLKPNCVVCAKARDAVYAPCLDIALPMDGQQVPTGIFISQHGRKFRLLAGWQATSDAGDQLMNSLEGSSEEA